MAILGTFEWAGDSVAEVFLALRCLLLRLITLEVFHSSAFFKPPSFLLYAHRFQLLHIPVRLPRVHGVALENLHSLAGCSLAAAAIGERDCTRARVHTAHNAPGLGSE